MITLTEGDMEFTPYDIGVCVTHCCARHGCKYGKNTCAVATGAYKQWYLCEQCEFDPEEQTLVAYQHNGFSIKVTGNPEGIDALKQLLIPNLLVKGIVTYGGDPLAKLSALNYTQLKELRK